MKHMNDEDGVKTRSLQRGFSEIENSSLLDKFHPASTSILVVDTNFITLQNMKNIMEQYAFKVTIYANAEEALAFLTNCKHEINIVIWEFHMPGINGLEALKIIGSKMDLPVVITSDDDQINSVMQATIHGACDYLIKPVREEVLGNIWQHIVRKRMMATPGLSPPVKLDLNKDESKIVDQDNSEQSVDETEEKAEKKPQVESIGEIQSDLVKRDGLDQEKDGSMTTNQINREPKLKKKIEKKPRMTWAGDLQEKFLKAINLVGGPKKANPMSILKCLQEMDVEGLTRNNVASHLQKYRISFAENHGSQQMLENDWSLARRPMRLLAPKKVHTTTLPIVNGHTTTLPLINGHTTTMPHGHTTTLPLVNGHTATLPVVNGHTTTLPLINGRGVNPVQESHGYGNGYLTMNNNQFMSNNQFMNNNQLMNNSLPHLPRFDHLQQQHLQQQQQQQPYHEPSHQLMSKKEDHLQQQHLQQQQYYEPSQQFMSKKGNHLQQQHLQQQQYHAPSQQFMSKKGNHLQQQHLQQQQYHEPSQQLMSKKENHLQQQHLQQQQYHESSHQFMSKREDHLQQQHLQQQQYHEPSHQLMNKKEPEQDSGLPPDLGLIYPSSPFDPEGIMIDGYNFTL
ncbi:unnamed protein product [Thlaspi arvense]|uniref:Response regulatory domain-containing protein n=1 Tax=Thlaspi arvense TaxID=13288 RepID=A0AAU9R8T7_THLAR|nr:unnamed protein product [Thlaspi arvense]